MELDPNDIILIYRKRWEIELLFKQLKQNFPLRYFYGESENAIKIQIWITLIANLLLSVMQRGLKRSWSFSVFATMVRITLMYHVDFYSLFNQPQKDCASSKTKCNKRVALAERCRRSRSVARGCLHLSARKKKQPAIQIKKGRPLSPQD
ncbi:transposase [Prevotella bivia]|nr:transposase [Prevotella bivia]WIL18607.1 transposase [Prevotella bivia]